MWNIVLLLKDILLIALEGLAIIICVVIAGSVIISVIDEIMWVLKGNTKESDTSNDKESKK